MAELNNPQVQKILHSKALAHLATNGSNGEPQSSPMWFLWDGEYIKFTHTTNRKKYQNIKRDPRVSISITDLDVSYIYAEFRGVVERIEDDPNGIFFNTLAKRYGLPVRNPGDPRVILYVKIQHIVGQNLNMGGYVFAQAYRVLPHRILVNLVKRLFRPKPAIPPMQEESVSPSV